MAVPLDATAVMRITHSKQFLESLSESFLYTNPVYAPNQNQLSWSLLAEFITQSLNNEKNNQHISEIYVSHHAEQGWLFAANTKIRSEEFRRLLKEHAKFEPLTSNRTEFYRINKSFNPENPHQIFSWVISNRLLLGSFSNGLLIKALQALNTPEIRNQHALNLANLPKTHANAVLAVDFRLLGNMLALNLNNQHQHIASAVKSLGQYALLDIIVRDNNLWFYGFIKCSDSNCFAASLDSYGATADLPALLPGNTIGFVRRSNLVGLRKNPVEVATAFTSGIFSSVSGGSVLLLRDELFEQNLPSILSRPSISNGANMLTTVNQLNETTNLREKYGYIVPHNRWMNHTLIENLNFFTENKSFLEQIKADIETATTLGTSKAFSQLKNYSTENSAFDFFLNTQGAYFAAQFMARDSVASDFIISMFPATTQFYWQIKPIDGALFTNAVLLHGKRELYDDNRIWEVRLPGKIIASPTVVFDQGSDGKNIIVFDDAANITMIDRNGAIRWQRVLAEPGMGEVHTLQGDQPETTRYLFNTPNYLYLIDNAGNILPGYPKSLAGTATTAATLARFANDQKPRLLIPTADRSIISIDLLGNRIAEWETLTMEHICIRPPQHIIYQGTSFVVLSDSAGRVVIANRRGIPSWGIPVRFFHAGDAAFYINRTNAKGAWLTADKQGRLSYLSPGGGLQQTTFTTFSNTPWFIYDDFNHDPHPDFIFADRQRLVVFDRFAQTLLEQRFTHPATIEPVAFRDKPGQLIIAIVEGNPGSISLYGTTGRLTAPIPARATVAPAIAYLDDEGLPIVISGSDDMLIAFPFLP